MLGKSPPIFLKKKPKTNTKLAIKCMQIKWLASSFDNVRIIDKGINNLLINNDKMINNGQTN
jgi:hypothetical protein